MPNTDPIADMLTQIRNAILVNKNELSLPHSTIKEKVVNILVENGFLKTAAVNDDDKFKQLLITINDLSLPASITKVAKVSRPGKRIYVKASQIPTIKSGRGIVVLSTSQGLMSGEQAKAKKLGGEIVLEVY